MFVIPQEHSSSSLHKHSSTQHTHALLTFTLFLYLSLKVMHLFASLVAVVVASATVSANEQYRVLILSPVASRSQYHLCAAIAEGLGEAGHEVTFVSSFKLKHTSKYVDVNSKAA